MTFRYNEGRWTFHPAFPGMREDELIAVGHTPPTLPEGCVAIREKNGRYFWADANGAQQGLPPNIRAACIAFSAQANAMRTTVEARRASQADTAQEAAAFAELQRMHAVGAYTQEMVTAGIMTQAEYDAAIAAMSNDGS